MARPDNGAVVTGGNGEVLRFAPGEGRFPAGMAPDLPAHHAATVDRANKGARLIVRGMALNAVLGLIKIAGGILGSAYALVAKVVFSRRLNEVGRDTESTALFAEAWHHLSDAMTSAAAFVGISIAVVGGPGYAAADGWAALVAAAVIAFNGGGIFKRALNEVMDIAVPARLETAVRAMAARVPGVASLDKCRVRKSGLSYLVDIQIRVPGDLSVREGHGIAHAVNDTLLASRLRVSDVTVHVEPY